MTFNTTVFSTGVAQPRNGVTSCSREWWKRSLRFGRDDIQHHCLFDCSGAATEWRNLTLARIAEKISPLRSRRHSTPLSFRLQWRSHGTEKPHARENRGKDLSTSVEMTILGRDDNCGSRRHSTPLSFRLEWRSHGMEKPYARENGGRDL